MGLRDLFRRPPAPERTADGHWTRTGYGFAPTALVTRNRRRDSGSFRGFSVQNYVVAGAASAAHAAKERLEHVFQADALLRGDCPACGEIWLVPELQSPLLFKCPRCAPAEERDALRFLSAVNDDGQAFERCPQCEAHRFLVLEKSDDAITLRCPECHTRLHAIRDGSLALASFSKTCHLVCCGDCKQLFELAKDAPDPFECPDCELAGTLALAAANNKC